MSDWVSKGFVVDIEGTAIDHPNGPGWVRLLVTPEMARDLHRDLGAQLGDKPAEKPAVGKHRMPEWQPVSYCSRCGLPHNGKCKRGDR